MIKMKEKRGFRYYMMGINDSGKQQFREPFVNRPLICKQYIFTLFDNVLIPESYDNMSVWFWIDTWIMTTLISTYSIAMVYGQKSKQILLSTPYRRNYGNSRHLLNKDRQPVHIIILALHNAWGNYNWVAPSFQYTERKLSCQSRKYLLSINKQLTQAKLNQEFRAHSFTDHSW